MSLVKKIIFFIGNPVGFATRNTINDEYTCKSHSCQQKKISRKLNIPNQNCNKGSLRMKPMKTKCAINEYKKKQVGDMTENNLLILKKLSDLKPKKETAHKILTHHSKKLNKGLPIVPEPEEDEPKSILFPEENKRKKRKKV